MVGHVTPYKVKKQRYAKQLSRRHLENAAVYIQAGVPAGGEPWWMPKCRQTHSAQCWGHKGPKGGEKLLYVHSSCLAIKYGFYVTCFIDNVQPS